ncbi:alkaline phosphatase family protein [Flavobacterium columnare NBRC 100251 = ATCC 23463]|uniref:Alkaline phosphatase family protein n=1 Tax=Flavobacterium columnare TaxID=996 RepID=A0AAI8CFB0_9FLAO|nr:alkaline phosphatase PafA [Flavobacterium columnare]AMO19106.1 alkaline phosphatase family protein [Flavobacterium columnare]APT21387.1 alkaline phosphatase [Flavobacterium columnare]AUX17042.1 alkaline phosphatase [Flavobacterium columnare]MBF6651626.1 alkaline phosphatase family protein [Flavobacterium columnare]MBF6654789.1 alkaline phosphatase family protein [Flavobacterium columnare]
MKNFFKVYFSVLSLAVSAQTPKINAEVKRPKLVVGIVVDQMKMEYLNRFYSDFSENGFKRLLRDGFTYHNMHYNYMPTFTGPGHASIYTGTTPAIHGIVGNEWFNKATGKNLYCTDDTDVSTVGNGTEQEGKMSPKILQASTITDELKLSTNFKGKVIGVSVKDRGAILPAGHFADWAFWFSKTGNFISSTFYGKSLPSWVTQFNNEKNYEKYVNQNWDLLKDKTAYNESLPDDNPYEGKLNKKQAFFPYSLSELTKPGDVGILRTTPFGNNFLADFAQKTIENEQLGKDEDTDFLTVSFSATDYIGHMYGPRSIELQDTYLRLDQTLASFLQYLDLNVGKDNYLLFLTADHAGAENVMHLKDNRYDVEDTNEKNIEHAIAEFTKTQFGENLLVLYDSFNVFLDKAKIKEKGLELSKVKNAVKEFLYTQKHVKRVYDENEIIAGSVADNYLNFVSKGYDPVQNGELIIVDKPAYMQYQTTGTSHGSPYSYDTHVPCLFYGWGIKKGENFDKKDITQIAPTLALKLKTTLPNSTDAIPLTEILPK